MSEASLESSSILPDTLQEVPSGSLSDGTKELNNTEPPKMSKNQQKRLLREARRKETKAEWRKLQKAKRKLKEQVKKEEYIKQGKLQEYIANFIIFLFRSWISCEKTGQDWSK